MQALNTAAELRNCELCFLPPLVLDSKLFAYENDMKLKEQINPVRLSKYRRIVQCLFVVSLISFVVISLPTEWKLKLESLYKPRSFYSANYQERRKEQIKLACNGSRGNDDSSLELQMSALSPSDFHALHYDDENKIIYCEVPKVACSNWKRVLIMLSGKMKANSLSDIPVNEVHSKLSKEFLRRMSELNMSEIRRRLEPSSGYFKFIFVREPFERLVSAYRNKFVAPYSTYFQQRFGRYIVSHFRIGNISEESMRRGHDVTFPEFIRFITSENIAELGEKTNPHWRPVSELCLPCLVDYDFIGKYETMDGGDVDYVLERLKLGHLSFPPAYNSGPNRTGNLVEEHYKGVPSDDFLKIKRLYRDDFQLFYPENASQIQT